jgi:hypothetical protein
MESASPKHDTSSKAGKRRKNTVECEKETEKPPREKSAGPAFGKSLYNVSR